MSLETGQPLKVEEIAIIAGSHSRRGEEATASLRKAFGDRAGLFVETQKREDLAQAIRRAGELGMRAAAVAGGDGTLGLAAPACREQRLPLAILPAGTGNALARELEIPLSPLPALEALLAGHRERLIDLGVFGDDVFVTVATFGLTSRIAKLLPESKGRWGILAYFPALIRSLRQPKPAWMKVETPVGDFEGYVYEFVAASSRLHGGPFPVSDKASIDDGLLSIYAVRSQAGRSLFRYGLSLLFGRHTELPEVWNVETDRAHVSLRAPGPFVVDGNRVRQTAVDLSILPGALRVFVPAAPTP